MNSKKPLHGCVLCRDCTNKTAPKPMGALTSRDMDILHYSGCSLDGDNRLIEADRKCPKYQLK